MHHRQPGAVELVERVPQGACGALEHARVGDVEVVAFGLEQPAGLLGLLHAGVGEVDVRPSGEAVFKIPGRFTVTDQYQFVHEGGLWLRLRNPAF